MLASMMTQDQVIDRLEEAIEEYKESRLLGKEKEDRSFGKVVVSCHLLMLNMVTDGDVKNAFKTIEKMKLHDEREKLFNVNKS